MPSTLAAGYPPKCVWGVGFGVLGSWQGLNKPPKPTQGLALWNDDRSLQQKSFSFLRSPEPEAQPSRWLRGLGKLIWHR